MEEYHQYKLNIPATLRTDLKASARTNGRSLSAEIIHRLTASAAAPTVTTEAAMLTRLEAAVKTLEVLTLTHVEVTHAGIDLDELRDHQSPLEPLHFRAAPDTVMLDALAEHGWSLIRTGEFAHGHAALIEGWAVAAEQGRLSHVFGDDPRPAIRTALIRHNADTQPSTAKD